MKVILSLFAVVSLSQAGSVSQPHRSALLGDAREQAFLRSDISDEGLHRVFHLTREHELAGRLDGAVSEENRCMLHAYLHVAGDHRFASALSQEPAATQRIVFARA